MSKNRNKKRQSFAERVGDNMTFNEYYDLFIAPALKVLAGEREQVLGVQFIRWICLGKTPQLKSDDDKLLWNCLMFACNREFNPEMAKQTAKSLQHQFNSKQHDNYIDNVIKEMLKM